ncbi:MAG: hypothetical protein GTN78_04455, partial [Gemmatimonadales bacterium]|nr:hypothetical protein [Gemmatimonadales bacterium]
MAETGATATSQAPPADTRRSWAVVIYMLFFLSGMTSLVYEVIWVRK